MMLRARSDVQFLSSRTNEARNSLLPLKSLPILPSEYGLGYRQCFLAPAGWTPEVDVEPLSNVKVHIDVERSEIIEFNRSYCDKGLIQGDRIYYTPVYWLPTDGLVDKSRDFVTWAERVVRAIKKSLIRDKVSGDYIGHDAAQKITSGELKVIP